MDWFLYDNGLRFDRVKRSFTIVKYIVSDSITIKLSNNDLPF